MKYMLLIYGNEALWESFAPEEMTKVVQETDALHRELREEVGIQDELPLEGPVALVDSIAPVRAFAAKHVVHIIFAGDLSGRSLEAVTSSDAAVRGHRLFDAPELEEIVLHPPIQRFLLRWEPGDPAVYLGALWAP